MRKGEVRREREGERGMKGEGGRDRESRREREIEREREREGEREGGREREMEEKMLSLKMNLWNLPGSHCLFRQVLAVSKWAGTELDLIFGIYYTL